MTACKKCGEEFPDNCHCVIGDPVDFLFCEHCGEAGPLDRHNCKRTAQDNQSAHVTAVQLLELAAECMKERGKQYETDPTAPSQERSMERIVQAFNAVCDKQLTVREGWLFMVLLKLVRMRASPGKLDNYVDAIAYAALLGDSSELT